MDWEGLTVGIDFALILGVSFAFLAAIFAAGYDDKPKVNK